jgi:Ca-activated chloride channel family protein
LGSVGRAALACLLAVALAGQEPPVFRVDVRLVRMLVTVKDVRGSLVGGLNREDFAVTDNGVPQEIALFERQTAQPLSVALLIDCSMSTARERDYEINSVRRFFKSLFAEGHPGDTVALYSFSTEVHLESSWTRNLRRLESALKGLKSRGATALFDAIYLSAENFDDRSGRRIVVVVSDGGDTASRVRFEQALEALHAADAVLYSILVVPIAGEAGRNVRGENALTTLSQWTGGRIFFPSVGVPLDQAFVEILRDLRTQYLIGYYPREVPASKDRFHRVGVKVNRPGHSVTARNGYFAGP